MNLALWLDRAGKSHGDRPAVGLGDRVYSDYCSLAHRAARLAGALQGQLGLNAGDRVAIVAKNSPAYLETLYAVWHAGLAAVPANAKLHGAELGYILEQARAEKSRTSHRYRQPRLRKVIHGRSDRDRAAQRGRSRLAVLHLGHDWTPEGSNAHTPQSVNLESRLRSRSRSDRARRSDPACCAYESRLGHLHHAACHATRRECDRGIRWLRAGRNLPTSEGVATGLNVCRADDDQTHDRLPRRLSVFQYPHHHLGRRADVCRGCVACAGSLRSALCADLRTG